MNELEVKYQVPYMVRLKDGTECLAMLLKLNKHCGEKEDKERLYTEEEVYRIIHGMEEEHGLSYGDDLIEDYI